MSLLVEPAVRTKSGMYKGLEQFYVTGDFSVMFDHKSDEKSVASIIKEFNEEENNSVINGKKIDSKNKIVISGYWDENTNDSFISSSYCSLSSYYKNIKPTKREIRDLSLGNSDSNHVELGTYIREILTDKVFNPNKLSSLKKIRFNHLSDTEITDLFSQVPGKVKSRLLVDIIDNPSRYQSRRGANFISMERLRYFTQILHENSFIYKAINDYSFMRIMGLSKENAMTMINKYGLKSLKTLSSNIYTLDGLSYDERIGVSQSLSSKSSNEMVDVYAVKEAMKDLHSDGSTAFPINGKWHQDLKAFKYSLLYKIMKHRNKYVPEAKIENIEKLHPLAKDALSSIRRTIDGYSNGCKSITFIQEKNGTKVKEVSTLQNIDPNYQYLTTYLCELDNYKIEKKIVEHIKRLVGTSEPKFIDESKLVFDGDFEPYEAQVDAVKKSFAYPVSIITGGPGVGKTTVLNSVLKTIEATSPKGTIIKLFGPTGKAASRMNEATGRESSTIHSGLYYKVGVGFVHNEDNKLEADVVVIDESSMVDSELFLKLLSSLKDNTKLIIVGDKDQLPSVGAGAILQELIASKVIPFTILNETKRQGAESDIVIAAYDIIDNKMPELKGKNDDPNDLIFIDAESDDQIMKEIRTLIQYDIPNGGNKMSDIQILSPRADKTASGITAHTLNKEFRGMMNESENFEKCDKAFNFRLGDRLICNTNDQRKGISNGHQGIITSIDNNNLTVNVKFEHLDEPILLDQDYLWKDSRFDLSYCMTIHKSQGSEYPIVIIPITKHAGDLRMLNAQLLYTAITRGKGKVYLVGSKEAMAKSISKTIEVERTSSLGTLLRTVLDVLDHELVNSDVKVILGGKKNDDFTPSNTQEKTPNREKTFEYGDVPFS